MQSGRLILAGGGRALRTNRRTRYAYTSHPVDDDRTLLLIDMNEMRTLRFRANAWDENLLALGYLEATASFAEDEDQPPHRDAQHET